MGILTQTHNGLNFLGTEAYIQADGSTKMTIKSDGNVGIGTTSPTTALQVVGRTKTSELHISNGNAIYTNTGNVGIGTTSPARKLDVAGTLHTTNAYVDEYIYHNADTDTHIQFTSDRVRIVAGGATKFDSNNTYHHVGGNGDDYTFKIADEGNLTGNKWYHVATLSSNNGGVHIRGSILNHVESFASQKLDIAIQVREAESGENVEITGSVDILHNATSGTDKAGVRVIQTETGDTYNDYKVYVRTCRYSMLTLRMTKEGDYTAFNTDHSSPLTTEPSPVGSIAVELDTSTLQEGNYVVDDSTPREIYHEGHKPTYAELGNMDFDNLSGDQAIINVSGFNNDANYTANGLATTGGTMTGQLVIQKTGDFTAAKFKGTAAGGFGQISVENDLGTALVLGSMGSTKTGTFFDNARYIGATSGELVLKTYSSTDGHMKFLTGGQNERMRITAGGNVGIGTTSPASKLHINDGSLQFDKTNTSGGGDFDFIKMGYNGSWSANQGGIAGISVDDATGVVGRYGITYGAGGGRFVVTDLYDGSYAQSGDVFYVRGDGDAYIQGSLGIGVTSPLAKLDIDGGSGKPLKLTTTNNDAIEFRGESSSPFTFIGYNGRGFRFWDSSNSELFRIASNGNITLPKYGAGYLKTDSDGNITVDTSTIEDTLDSVTDRGSTTTNNISVGTLTASGGGNTVVLKKGTGTPALAFAGTSDEASALIEGISGGGLKIYTSNGGTLGTPAWSNKMTVTAGGNVGIGTTSPSHKLDVNGDVRASNLRSNSIIGGTSLVLSTSGGANIELYGAGSAYYDAVSHVFRSADASSTAMQINTSTGNVGIGTTSPTRPLSVEGTAYVRDDFAVTVTNPATNIQKDSQLYLQSKGNQSGTIRSSQWYFQTESDSIYGNSGLSISKKYDGGSTYEYLRITSAGNVGIGTTNPGEKLEVSGNVKASGWIGRDSDNYITFDETNNYIDFYAGGNWVARMESDGDLHVKGDVIAFSDIFNP